MPSLEAFASCLSCIRGDAEPMAAGRFLRVDAPVHARLALLSPQERLEATAAALKGQMDEESGEEVEHVSDLGKYTSIYDNIYCETSSVCAI